MRARVRTINKIGGNAYITTSSSISEHIFALAVYYVIIYPYILIYKYCIYMPIKFLIKKIKEIKLEENKNE